MPKITPADLAKHLRQVKDDLRPAVMASEAETVKEGLAAAVRQSSGTSSGAVLRRVGHPFAVRAPNSAFDPALINRQSGAFLAAWRAVPPSVQGGKIVSGVVNRDRAAKYMAGTRSMIAWPIVDAVRASVDPAKRRARLIAAVRRVLLP